jgi:hypothetical protein
MDSTYFKSIQDSLKENLCENKELLNEFELQTLIALSYFPELNTRRIKFKEAKINSTMSARPTVISLLTRKSNKRKYVIRVTNRKADSTVRLQSASFNAQVGVIGHELSHISDYNNRNITGIIKRLFQYRKIETKEVFEKEIDSITVYHGLGWQLYDWSHFVLNESKASLDYLDYKRKVYQEPAEIEILISNYKAKLESEK